MTYEFKCTDCDNHFDVQATIAEKEAGLKPICPQCGSGNTVQRFSIFGMSRGAPGAFSIPSSGCGFGGASGSSCCG